jgi:hypothetical protein
VAGDPLKANLWTDADVYVSTNLSATLPANANTPFGGDWDLVGLLDGDEGFPESRDEDTDDKFAWGGILVRTSRNHFKLTKSFTALEDNETTYSLLWPGSSATQIIVPRPAKVLVAFETREGDKVRRLISANYAEVSLDGDHGENEADLESMTFAGHDLPDRRRCPVHPADHPDPVQPVVSPSTLPSRRPDRRPDGDRHLRRRLTADVTASASWSSSATPKATVSSGFVTGVAPAPPPSPPPTKARPTPAPSPSRSLTAGGAEFVAVRPRPGALLEPRRNRDMHPLHRTRDPAKARTARAHQGRRHPVASACAAVSSQPWRARRQRPAAVRKHPVAVKIVQPGGTILVDGKPFPWLVAQAADGDRPQPRRRQHGPHDPARRAVQIIKPEPKEEPR